MFAQNTLNRGFLVAAATASVCCGTLVTAAPSYASGFAGYYDLSNWTRTTTGSTPTINQLAAGTIEFDYTGTTSNTYSRLAETTGILSFDWNFSDATAKVNSFSVFIGGNEAAAFNFVTTNVPANFSTLVNDGQEIQLAFSTNAAVGDPTKFTISNFQGPVIPTPAMLPGLMGMWMAAMRKKRQ